VALEHVNGKLCTLDDGDGIGGRQVHDVAADLIVIGCILSQRARTLQPTIYVAISAPSALHARSTSRPNLAHPVLTEIKVGTDSSIASRDCPGDKGSDLTAAPQRRDPSHHVNAEGRAFRQNANDALTSRCGVSTLMGCQLEEAGAGGMGVRGPADTRC